MKTLKRKDEIVRVTDTKSDSYLNRGFSFCPKSEWKTNIRDFTKTKKEEDNTVKSETKKISKKKLK